MNNKNLLTTLCFVVLYVCAACGQTTPSNSITPAKSAAAIGIVGDTADLKTNAHRAGFVLAGGSTDIDAAMQWLSERAAGGDLVVIRASGSTGYNQYWYDLHKVNSVETLLINSRTLASDAYVVRRLREAEAVFIAGGDQSNYINFWKGTPVETALNYLINDKKVAIGGTSAGCAVLGEGVYDALTGSVTSAEALANPYHATMSLQSGNFLKINVLKNIITDTHYAQRERQARHFTFLARLVKDFAWTTAKGIGVDEKTAVCIDENGQARIFGENDAYFLINNAATPEICAPNQPLTWNHGKNAVRVYQVRGTSNGTATFDLSQWTGNGGKWLKWYAIEGKFFTE